VLHLLCGFLLLLKSGGAPVATAAPTDALPPAARQAIARQMAEHSSKLTTLLTAVLLLDHDQVRRYASDIANAPMVARPLPGEKDTVIAQIPKRFFDLQDQLATQGKALAEAAGRHDDAQMGAAFGRLTDTCVTCHAVYLWKGQAAR
jgi:cytochrome c556